MNFKKHLFPMALCLTSIAFAGCGQSTSTNTNMHAQEMGIPVSTAKLYNFDAALGIDPNPTDIVASLKAPPASFLSENKEAYARVSAAVAQQLISIAPFTQALKVDSIEVFKPINNLALNGKQTNLNSIPYPYFENGELKHGDLSGLSDKTDSGIDKNGHFSVRQAVNGKINTDSPATGTVYLIKYELGIKDGAVPTGADAPPAAQYQALVTIPDSASQEPLPLMLFAHGGDAGLTFREMATLLQGNLGKYIVAAPVYPGEPICSYDFQVGVNNVRECIQRDGSHANPLEDKIGEKSPMKWDVNSLLGLHNAIQKLATTQTDKFLTKGYQNPFIDGNNKSIIALQKNDPTYLNTVAVADSRGGGTLLAALGREGFLSSAVDSDNKPLCAVCTTTSNFFPHISAAAFYYSPSSFLVGQFRILSLQMLFNSVAPAQQSLPMVPEMTHYFDAYRSAPVGSEGEKKELNKLVGFLASSDISFLAPYVTLEVQNYTHNKNTFGQMPGSVIFMHGTQDQVVPFSESVIAQTVFDGVLQNFFAHKTDSNPLLLVGDVPIGSQMYSFQPDVSFYTVPFGKDKCGDPSDILVNLVNYNPILNKCFYGTGMNAKGFSDHGLNDAFLTSHIENYELQKINVTDTALTNEFLYGVDPIGNDYLYPFDSGAANFKLQLSNINLAEKEKYKIYSSSDCEDDGTVSGQCNSFAMYSSPENSIPLYYRSLAQDSIINSNYLPAVLGTWDEGAQKSVMTPIDILTSWLNTMNSDKGVFVSFTQDDKTFAFRN